VDSPAPQGKNDCALVREPCRRDRASFDHRDLPEFTP
jgi:hypothetical protein